MTYLEALSIIAIIAFIAPISYALKKIVKRWLSGRRPKGGGPGNVVKMRA